MESIEQRLARLDAKDEIRELTARYCHAVVDGDADRIVELFCTDGIFRTQALAPEGHEELREFYKAGVGGKTHKPFVQNHVIEFDDEKHASGRCSVEIRVWQDGQAYTQAGHYHDRYRREDGRWRFAERHYVRYHNAPWQTGWIKN
jgi:uncharacterized protein (TIGR02246 family)